MARTKQRIRKSAGGIIKGRRKHSAKLGGFVVRYRMKTAFSKSRNKGIRQYVKAKESYHTVIDDIIKLQKEKRSRIEYIESDILPNTSNIKFPMKNKALEIPKFLLIDSNIENLENVTECVKFQEMNLNIDRELIFRFVIFSNDDSDYYLDWMKEEKNVDHGKELSTLLSQYYLFFNTLGMKKEVKKVLLLVSKIFPKRKPNRLKHVKKRYYSISSSSSSDDYLFEEPEEEEEEEENESRTEVDFVSIYREFKSFCLSYENDTIKSWFQEPVNEFETIDEFTVKTFATSFALYLFHAISKSFDEDVMNKIIKEDQFVGVFNYQFTKYKKQTSPPRRKRINLSHHPDICYNPNAEDFIDVSSSDEYMMKLWNSRRRFTNITLVSSDGKEFECHQELLVLRFNFFQKMFNFKGSEMEELRVSGKINLEDISSQVLQQIMNYTYFQPIEFISSSSSNNFDIFCNLLQISCMYFEEVMTEYLLKVFLDNIQTKKINYFFDSIGMVEDSLHQSGHFLYGCSEKAKKIVFLLLIRGHSGINEDRIRRMIRKSFDAQLLRKENQELKKEMESMKKRMDRIEKMIQGGGKGGGGGSKGMNFSVLGGGVKRKRDDDDDDLQKDKPRKRRKK